MKYLPQIIELADGTKCVRLEDFRRECDEAREAIRALAEHGESEIQRITKERDEARRELENMKETKRDLMQMVYGRNWVEQDLLKERDEARAITKEAITGLYNLGDYDLANRLSSKLEETK
jgi:hypothetical protein